MKTNEFKVLPYDVVIRILNQDEDAYELLIKQYQYLIYAMIQKELFKEKVHANREDWRDLTEALKGSMVRAVRSFDYDVGIKEL